MNNYILASIIILIITALAVAFIPKKLMVSSKINKIYFILTGVFLSIFAVMLYVDNKPLVYGSETTIFLALFHTVQIMLAGYDFEFLHEAFVFSTAPFSTPYIYMAFLFVLAPICTFSFVLSFFKSITSYIKFLFFWKRDTYILSNLSEKSVALANSIHSKFPKAIIIFTNVFANTETEYDLLDEVNLINGLVFKSDIFDFGIKMHSKKSKLSYFLIKENESDNLKDALNLIEKLNSREKTEMYVFSTSKEGELLLDSADFGKAKVRRVNENQMLAYSIINDEKTMITKDVTIKDDKKIISTLVVGFGGYGEEITKSLLWCGQLPGYELEINVIDKSPKAESYFKAKCPEIFKLNNNKELGETIYSLNFFNEVDVSSYEFTETLKKLSNTSVVYVSLGNDELNIETAISIRILFERMGIYPKIRAIVFSDVKNKTIVQKGLINYKEDNYDIEIIGNISSRYDYDKIVNEKIEEKAIKYHYAWAYDSDMSEEDLKKTIENETKKFNQIEYYRNSSIATAIHDTYRKSENIPEKNAIVYEHIRWNAYMRTEGYIFSGSYDKKTRNDRAKMHHDLVKQEILNDKDITKDKKMVNV